MVVDAARYEPSVRDGALCDASPEDCVPEIQRRGHGTCPSRPVGEQFGEVFAGCRTFPMRLVVALDIPGIAEDFLDIAWLAAAKLQGPRLVLNFPADDFRPELVSERFRDGQLMLHDFRMS